MYQCASIPDNMIYKTDYHMHTSYSDGRTVPEEYVAQAIATGMNEIGFSEHLNLFRELQNCNMDPARIPEYLAHIGNLKTNNNEIDIKVGLEVDFFPGKEEELGSFLKPLPLDYVIGSVHYQGDKTVDGSREFYEDKDIEFLYEEYFGTVISAVSSGLFDIIGHCDLIRIFGYRPVSDPEPLYRKLAKAMKKFNVAFEVNTNGRNRPIADFYPDRRFLHIFREERIPVCVNSDAHMPARIGQYFDEAYELLRYIGFTEMAVFDKRERSMIPF